jgi:hypothetical protein
MSGDPLGGRIDDPQTLNRYSYVRDNPIDLVDPTGLDCQWVFGVLTCNVSDSGGDSTGGGDIGDFWSSGACDALAGGCGGGPSKDQTGTFRWCVQQYKSDGVRNWGTLQNLCAGWPGAPEKRRTPTIGPNHNYEGSKKQLCNKQSDLAFWENILPFGKTLLGGKFDPGTVGYATASYAAGRAIVYGADSPKFLRWVRSSPLEMPMTVTSKILTGLGIALAAYSVYDSLEAGKDAYQACMAD